MARAALDGSDHPVNPYLATALAMCVIVALSLAATAYLAVVFNRRARADLAAALAPLADAVGGRLDLDEATVSGRWAGHLVFGRVANAPGGIGRLFHAEVIDAAGGTAWEWSSLPAKDANQPPIRAFESADPILAHRLGVDWPAAAAAAIPDPARERFGFLHDPQAGHVRLTRAMRTRRDIPDAATFVRQLDVLAAVARANRRAQGAPPGEHDADAPLPPFVRPVEGQP